MPRPVVPWSTRRSGRSPSGQASIGVDCQPASAFEAELGRHFPGAVPQQAHIAATARLLSQWGFTPDNSVVCTAMCNDDIATPLLRDIETIWGPVYTRVSRAGFLPPTQNGFKLGDHHATTEHGKRHVVLYTMPHLTMTTPRTTEEPSDGSGLTPRGCHHLEALLDGLRHGDLRHAFGPRAERSLLRQRVRPHLSRWPGLDIIQLTKLAVDAIHDDLWDMFCQLTPKARNDRQSLPLDGAMLTGIQLTGPAGETYIWPQSGYVLYSGHSIPSPLPRPSSDSRGAPGTYPSLIEGSDPRD